MGTGASRPSNGDATVTTRRYSYKCITYDSQSNSIVVVYGRGRELAHCILTDEPAVPGAAVDLMGSTDTICIFKRRAVIRNSGIIRMENTEALLRMEEGASIEVGINGRLSICGMLLMEKNARLVVEPGAYLQVKNALYVTGGTTATISVSHCQLWNQVHMVVNPTPTNSQNVSYMVRSVTWVEEDQRFLVKLMLFFCSDHRLPPELIYPLLLPTVCQRYGVLMQPRPYRMDQYSIHKNRVEVME
jgi:hypothetical protein